MFIHGLEKSSLIDYPGKISCVVFLAGCNFRCQFCYNSELVLPELIKKQPKTSEEKFFNFLKTRQGLLDGVVITGGEPTIHNDLLNFIKKIKNLGFLVKLDTNGTNPEIIEKLINERLIDYIAMDIKASVDAKNHLKLNRLARLPSNPNEIGSLRSPSHGASGASNSKIKNRYEQVIGTKVNLGDIKKSIKIVKNSGIDHEFRTTIVPTLHTKKDIIDIAKYLHSVKFVLQPFNRVNSSKYFLQNFRKKGDKVIDKNLKEDSNFLFEISKKLPKELNVKIRN